MPHFRPVYRDEDMKDYHIPEGNIYTQAMNCCLHNHPATRTRDILEWYQVTLATSLNRFFFCLTGLKKDVYSAVYGVDDVAYLEIYDSIHHKVEAILRRRSCPADVFMVLENDTKQIVVVFSPPVDGVLPAALAEEIGRAAQETYEQRVFHGDRRYCNVTALSGELHGFTGIREGYLQARELNDLSFFHMEPGVLTRERVEALRGRADYQTVMEGCVRLCRTLDEGDREGCRAALEDLFLNLLRGSYSVSLLWDALSHCKHMLQVRCTVRGLIDALDLETLCDAGSYLRIEECVDALWPVLEAVCTAVEKQGVFNRTALNAGYYIRCHCAEDITLPEIAAYVGVNATYLSNIFRENTGRSIRDYVTAARIQKGKALLRQGMRVAAAAAAAGFCDAKYFARVFKKLTGVSPARYREEHG